MGVRRVFVWVPRMQDGRPRLERVQGEPCGNDEYILDFEPFDEEAEGWVFLPGERVRCDMQVLESGEEGLVAVDSIVYLPSLLISADPTRHTIEIRGMEPIVYSRRPSRNEPFVLWSVKMMKTEHSLRPHVKLPIVSMIDKSAKTYHLVITYDPNFALDDVIERLLKSSQEFGFTWRVDPSVGR